MHRSRRALGPLAALTVALVAALGLTACTPSNDDAQISAVGFALRSEAPDPQSDDAAGRAALELRTSPYLMLQPVELTTEQPLPADGITLRFSLPAALPEGVTARFTFFDDGAQAWIPVDTEVDGTTATATVTHLSLWSIVVTGTEEMLGAVVDAFDAAGAAVADAGEKVSVSLAAWSTYGPGSWIYRQAGLLLGLQAEAPTCEQAYPDWVDTVTISMLTDIPAHSQSVLRCAGVDPGDPQLLQIKAAANRAFGFPMDVAAGVEPRNVTWSILEDASLAELDTLLDVLSEETANGVFQDPRAFVPATTEVAFSVSEEEAEAAQGGHLVAFPKPSAGQAALSVLYKYVFDQLEDAVPGVVGIVLALRACDPGGLPIDAPPAEGVGYLLACAATVGDEDFQQDVDDFVSRHSTSSNWPASVETLWEHDRTAQIRKVLSVLKWADAVALGLTFVDHVGERDDTPWWVDVSVAQQAPVWEDLAGTWCFVSGDCYDYAPGTQATSWGSQTITQESMSDGCFLGAIADDQGTGASLAFCPASVPTSTDIPGAEPGLPPAHDNPAFDRLFIYQGYGNVALFRQSDLAAATSG